MIEPRTDPPLTGDEVSMLLAFLDYHRATLEAKTSGLDAASLNATMPPTTMTLAGLLKHLAGVEEWWFWVVVAGEEESAPWTGADPDDADWDWHSAVDDTPEALRQLWRDQVAKSRRVTAAALGRAGLDTPARRVLHEQERSLRWVLLHMIEEYARHNGHADLLREAVDGSTGE